MVIFEELPEDLALMILLRLPVKSLSRFKSVSKSWCTLIRDPSFIAKHIKFNSYRDFLLVTHLDQSANSQVFSFFTHQTFEPAGSLVHNLNRIQGNSLFVQILGPCNGVFCLFDGKETIALWNPAIKELQIVPPSDVIPPPNAGTLDTCIGFGFDPKTEDYKVLAFKHLCTHSVNAMAHAELYSLQSNSWKLVDVADEFQPLGNLPISAFNPSIDGVFSWFEMDDHVDKVIFSFDMSKAVFMKTHLPDYGIPSKRVHGKLVSFKNSLAFIHDYSLGETAKGFDVWILGEYGSMSSWTKYLTIGPVAEVKVPLGFLKSGELLFEDIHGELICYDSTTEAMKKLNVGGAKNSLSIFHYRESLVSVKTGKEPEGDSSNRFRSKFEPVGPTKGGPVIDHQAAGWLAGFRLLALPPVKLEGVLQVHPCLPPTFEDNLKNRLSRTIRDGHDGDHRIHPQRRREHARIRHEQPLHLPRLPPLVHRRSLRVDPHPARAHLMGRRDRGLMGLQARRARGLDEPLELVEARLLDVETGPISVVGPDLLRPRRR
ncbi:hypothetical protein V2J09_005382 [Rumex salicifolius]